MKNETYEKAHELKKKMSELEYFIASIEQNGTNLQAYNPDLGGTVKLSEEFLKLVDSSVISVLKTQLRNLQSEFMML